MSVLQVEIASEKAIVQTSTLMPIIDNLNVGYKEDKHTHDSMCVLAARWLIRKQRCRSVLVERGCGAGEMPDVIGFYYNDSYLIEVKDSRSDFIKDKAKPHRVNPSSGMGKYRWYICPKDMIKPDEVPEGWGLLYVTAGGIIRQVKGGNAFQDYNKDMEFVMLTSALASPWKLFQHWSEKSIERLAGIRWMSKHTEAEMQHFAARVAANSVGGDDGED